MARGYGEKGKKAGKCRKQGKSLEQTLQAQEVHNLEVPWTHAHPAHPKWTVDDLRWQHRWLRLLSHCWIWGNNLRHIQQGLMRHIRVHKAPFWGFDCQCSQSACHLRGKNHSSLDSSPMAQWRRWHNVAQRHTTSTYQCHSMPLRTRPLAWEFEGKHPPLTPLTRLTSSPHLRHVCYNRYNRYNLLQQWHTMTLRHYHASWCIMYIQNWIAHSPDFEQVSEKKLNSAQLQLSFSGLAAMFWGAWMVI